MPAWIRCSRPWPTRRGVRCSIGCSSDGQTLAELAIGRGMTRQAVAKHLVQLESAGLVITRFAGREKQHFLDPAPIRGILGHWIGKYAGPR